MFLIRLKELTLEKYGALPCCTDMAYQASADQLKDGGIHWVIVRFAAYFKL